MFVIKIKLLDFLAKINIKERGHSPVYIDELDGRRHVHRGGQSEQPVHDLVFLQTPPEVIKVGFR